uniref:BOLA class I histocompatibility antigen, alpha chain BL3-7-like n=1 Tax=Monopterus albus TaxID=43700 RepID=UPI0009B3EA9A
MVIHFLVYFITTSSGLRTLPEYVTAAQTHGVVVFYCDSNRYKQECKRSHKGSKVQLERLNLFFNQTGGVHVLQNIYGCQWDNETGQVDGYDQYGYDGEDFVSFDLKTETWKYSGKAVDIKYMWDRGRGYLTSINVFLTVICPERLKLYLDYGKTSLLRTVSLLQKTPSSPVSCHATGFYPNRVDMFWRKDGEELHEDVDHGEILPNNDGTFQMSVDLNISSVKPEDWSRYDCVFQLSGVKEDVVTKLDKAFIRTNWAPPLKFAVIGVVVVLVLLLVVCISGLFIWRRRKKGEGQRY